MAYSRMVSTSLLSHIIFSTI